MKVGMRKYLDKKKEENAEEKQLNQQNIVEEDEK